MGPFAGYAQNADDEVLGMHRDALPAIDRSLAPSACLAARRRGDDAVGLAEIYGSATPSRRFLRLLGLSD